MRGSPMGVNLVHHEGHEGHEHNFHYAPGVSTPQAVG
jgi:hypothetical protein